MAGFIAWRPARVSAGPVWTSPSVLERAVISRCTTRFRGSLWRPRRLYLPPDFCTRDVPERNERSVASLSTSGTHSFGFARCRSRRATRPVASVIRRLRARSPLPVFANETASRPRTQRKLDRILLSEVRNASWTALELHSSTRSDEVPSFLKSLPLGFESAESRETRYERLAEPNADVRPSDRCRRCPVRPTTI